MKKKKLFGILKAAAASGTPDIFENIKHGHSTPMLLENIEERKATRHPVPRFASCIAVALALVIGSSIFTTAVNESKADSFEIVAYAADGKGKAVTLKENVSFALSKMFTFVDKSLISVTTTSPFTCTGKNLASVTYTSQKGLIEYVSHPKNYTFQDILNTFHNQTMRAASAALKKATVCSFKIPKSVIKFNNSPMTKNQEHIVYNNTAFKNLWNAGKLKKYSKGFSQKLSCQTFYNSYPYNAIITYDWNPINPDEVVSKDVYVVTIADTRNKNLSFIAAPAELYTSSVIVNPSDKNARLHWYSMNWNTSARQSDSDIRKAYQNAKSCKGSTVIDTITVTVKFKDGKTEIKHIQILFNSKLQGCMKLTD